MLHLGGRGYLRSVLPMQKFHAECYGERSVICIRHRVQRSATAGCSGRQAKKGFPLCSSSHRQSYPPIVLIQTAFVPHTLLVYSLISKHPMKGFPSKPSLQVHLVFVPSVTHSALVPHLQSLAMSMVEGEQPS